jgi:CRP-like cAMP-binding protein
MSGNVNVLLATRLFNGLTAEDLEQFADRFESVEYAENELVIREGQASTALHVILDGEFEVVLPEGAKGNNPQRAEDVELVRLQVGNCFGEFSIFDGEPACASVMATCPSEAIRISRDYFFALTEDDRIGKQVYRNLVEMLISKIRQTDREYDLMLSTG